MISAALDVLGDLSPMVAIAERHQVTRLGGRVGSTLLRRLDDEHTFVATGAAACIVS